VPGIDAYWHCRTIPIKGLDKAIQFALTEIKKQKFTEREKNDVLHSLPKYKRKVLPEKKSN
jgi:hypothetical protein